jgi:hypothetical protein
MFGTARRMAFPEGDGITVCTIGLTFGTPAP